MNTHNWYYTEERMDKPKGNRNFYLQDSQKTNMLREVKDVQKWHNKMITLPEVLPSMPYCLSKTKQINFVYNNMLSSGKSYLVLLKEDLHSVKRSFLPNTE